MKLTCCRVPHLCQHHAMFLLNGWGVLAPGVLFIFVIHQFPILLTFAMSPATLPAL
jgi:hypothetical protein